MLGRVFYESGSAELAIEVFRKGLEKSVDPHDKRTISLNLLACYMKMDDLLHAKRVFYSIEESSDDIAYLLYKSILFHVLVYSLSFNL